MKAPRRIFVFDFDSTLVQVESLPELARLSLKHHPERAARLQAIEGITELTATGMMEMADGIAARIDLMEAQEKHLESLTRVLKRSLTPSVKRNRAFFKKFRDSIYVISNGFEEFIIPVVESLGLRKDRVFANRFLLGEDGAILGCDGRNPLIRQDGKARVLKDLQLGGEVIVIGDGYSDFKIKEAGIASHFYAFTENARREPVVRHADHVLPSLDEFLYIHRFPMSVSYPKTRIKVLLVEGVHDLAAEQFEKEGYSVRSIGKGVSEEELIQELDDTTLLGIRSGTRITSRVLEATKKLKGIGAFCIGTNQIDLPACSRNGVIVFNAPYANTRSVVELAMGSILMLARRTFEQNRDMHRGRWNKSSEGAFEVRGKRLGIVGYGNIGSQLSILGEAIGMDVHYYDIVEKLPLGNATKCASLSELLKKSDVISVHVDGNQRNENLFDGKQFRLMKPGAMFLNLSRGFVVDTKALARALQSGHLGGAALDVFPEEPQKSPASFTSGLQGLRNVILTPHIGGSTREAQENIARSVSRSLISFVNSGSSVGSVNFPRVQLPDLRRAHRFIHIHENQPGVLAAINSVMAEHRINILGQYLKTNEQIGYVITDVSRKYQRKVIDDLQRIAHTIRFRVLY